MWRSECYKSSAWRLVESSGCFNLKVVTVVIMSASFSPWESKLSLFKMQVTVNLWATPYYLPGHKTYFCTKKRIDCWWNAHFLSCNNEACAGIKTQSMMFMDDKNLPLHTTEPCLMDSSSCNKTFFYHCRVTTSCCSVWTGNFHLVDNCSLRLRNIILKLL